MRDLLSRFAGIHDRLAETHPKLSRGMVWCRTCGRSQSVNPAGSLRGGWPKCCGYTMTIDSPEEQAALKAAAPLPGEEMDGSALPPNSKGIL
jgi:hypothetical protein